MQASVGMASRWRAPQRGQTSSHVMVGALGPKMLLKIACSLDSSLDKTCAALPIYPLAPTSQHVADGLTPVGVWYGASAFDTASRILSRVAGSSSRVARES